MLRRLYVFLISALLLSSCALGGNQATVTVTPTPTSEPSSILSSPTPENLQSLLQTEQMLLMTPHPVRDLYSLAQRLKLHTTTTIPHVVRTTPLNAHVGKEDTFWISNQDTRRYSRITAQLVYVTPHVYM